MRGDDARQEVVSSYVSTEQRIPNQDVVRSPGGGTTLSAAPYLARGMIHKVFALSKDRIENQRNAYSLFDELPRRWFEIRFGKFSLPDFFDVNAAGSNTHFQFTNWTVDQNGAWDYAADTRGCNRDRGPVLVPSFRAHVEF